MTPIGPRGGNLWKGREVYSGLSVPGDRPVVVRVDGWNFHSLAREVDLAWPYDERLIRAAVEAAGEVLRSGLPISLAYLFSDEVSYLIGPPIPFSGRVEKIVSVVASLTSSALSLSLWRETGRPRAAAMDGRVILLDWDEIGDYLSWRQSEAWRNHLNAYAQLALLRKGLSGREAADRLSGLKSSDLHDLIWRELGINPTETPSWQRRGVLVYWARAPRRAVDPRTEKEVTVFRRALRIDWEIPIFSSEEGRKLLGSILGWALGGPG